MLNSVPRPKIPRQVWLLGVLGVAALVAVSAWFGKEQASELRNQAADQLQSIARLKLGQIVDWRTDRLADAGALADEASLVAQVATMLTDGDAIGSRDLLLRFRSFATHYGYDDMMLVDPTGRVRLSLRAREITNPRWTQDLHGALAATQPSIIDTHVSAIEPERHIDLVAPLRQGPTLVGGIVLVLEVRHFLDPLVASWPLPSTTAETLLIRREGDDALYLNALRHQKDSALRLRIPLTRTDVPAVQAVLGRQGLFEGVDYRGVAVVSAVLPVPDSPWFIVAKDDAEVVYAGAHHSTTLVVFVTLGILAVLGLTGLVVWGRRMQIFERDRLAAQRTQNALLARQATTLRSIGDGVIATNADGHVELLNPVAEALTGWRTEDACGRPVSEVFHILDETTREPALNPVARALGEGVVVPMANHTTLITRGGTERPIADTAAPIRDEGGQITGAVLVFRDQTAARATNHALDEARRRAEAMAAAAESANRAKSDFLARMSHELRTPLNGVFGMAALLEETPLASDQRACVEVIRDSGKALLSLVNEVLDLAKIEAHRFELEAEEFDVHAWLDDFAKGTAVAMHAKGLTCTCTVAAGVPARLRGDARRLAQILGNLTSNALKFTPSGGTVAVHVASGVGAGAATAAPGEMKAAPGSETLRFTVRDTGIGIPADKLDVVFQSFAQADVSTTRRFGGTGLGLAIAKELAELMGGAIGVTSREGEGSEFWFTVRLQRAAALKPLAAPGTKPSALTVARAHLADRSGARILLVEDNRTNQFVAHEMLKRLGMKADLATHGLEAVAACQKAHYALILMDVEMPEMDGLDATRQIRLSDKNVPIVAMTAHAMASDRERCLAAGMSDYLTKPLDLASLGGMLDRWLAHPMSAPTA